MNTKEIILTAITIAALVTTVLWACISYNTNTARINETYVVGYSDTLSFSNANPFRDVYVYTITDVKNGYALLKWRNINKTKTEKWDIRLSRLDTYTYYYHTLK